MNQKPGNRGVHGNIHIRANEEKAATGQPLR
jgi:hypothetical protein